MAQHAAPAGPYISHALEMLCRWQHLEYKMCKRLQSGALCELLQALQQAKQLLLGLPLLLQSAVWQALLASS